MVTTSNNGSFGAEYQTNKPIVTTTQLPKQARIHECGAVVNESTGICGQCFGQLTESTAKPILLD